MPVVVSFLCQAPYVARSRMGAAKTTRLDQTHTSKSRLSHASFWKSASDATKKRGLPTQIQRRLGANEEFTGNGATKNLLDNNSQYGVVETFTYDKNPQTLAKLEASGSAKRIAAKPL